MDSPPPLEALRALHADVDAQAGALAARHAERLQCRRGCADCCRDGLTVFEVEAERIRVEAAELLASAEPHPEGACAFLDGQGACRIYAQRPYVCRTQGLPLRWLEERDEAVVELRDICPLNDGDGVEPLEGLPPEACWTLGPCEGRLAELQRSWTGALERAPLRSLFARGGAGAGGPDPAQP
jgi:hypothetical protein